MTTTADRITTETKEQLERIIDRVGLELALEWIAEICWEKAEHLRTNWQDQGRQSKDWDRDGRIIATTAGKMRAS